MLNIGIIGTGVGLRTHWRNLRHMGNVRVKSIAGRNVDRTRELCSKEEFTGKVVEYEEICADTQIDLVIVASPNHFHFRHVSAALQSDKHVLCEKPLAEVPADAVVLAALAADRSDQLSVVNHQLRFNPFIRKAREIVQNGRIGKPYFARVDFQGNAFTDPDQPWSWVFDSKLGGGVRMAIGSHLVDIVSYLLSAVVIAVSGNLSPVVEERKGPNGVRNRVLASGFCAATLTCLHELTVQISATACAYDRSKLSFSFFGDDGELHFDIYDKLRGAFGRRSVFLQHIPVEGVCPTEIKNKGSIFGVSSIYSTRCLVDALSSNQWRNIFEFCQFSEAVSAQAILDAIRQSANRGTMVYTQDSRIANECY